MHKIKIILAISILFLTIQACNALASSPAEPIPTTIVEVISTPTAVKIPLTEADVPRVSLEKAKAASDNGAAIIVDVRSKEAYDASHIPGAINIPLGDFETNPANLDLPKDAWIITYCT